MIAILNQLPALLHNPLALFSWITMAGLVFILFLSLLNSVTFPRLKIGQAQKFPLVSLLIPARNEADNLQQNLASWLSQDYANYEVIVLDDNSEDDTFQLAQTIASGDARFTVVHGEPLADGWLGKNWACQQLAQLARGQVLVFTDADIHWHPHALSAIMAAYEKYHADAITIWPTQITASFSERLVVPMMMFVLLGYLPEIFVRWLPFPIFAAANGQCLAFTRETYQQIGGHAAVAYQVVEDVALARLVKRHHRKLVMALGGSFIVGRMYRDWASVRNGFAKNILAGHASSPAFLVLSALFHWSLFLFPWLLLLLGWLTPQAGLWPAIPLVMILLGLASRAVTAKTAHLRASDALWMPLSVILMTIISGQSLLWHFRDGGPQWKGRALLHSPANGSPGHSPAGKDSASL